MLSSFSLTGMIHEQENYVTTTHELWNKTVNSWQLALGKTEIKSGKFKKIKTIRTI